MTRYLLDTNIISQATKPTPSQSLLLWLTDREDEDLFISTLSLGEIRRGILEKEQGRKRRELEAWFAGPEGPQALFAGRVLAFDGSAALIWARLMAEGTAEGRPRSALDMVIAAVAEANNCIVVTDNERHFRAVPTINPIRQTRCEQTVGVGRLAARASGPRAQTEPTSHTRLILVVDSEPQQLPGAQYRE